MTGPGRARRLAAILPFCLAAACTPPASPPADRAAGTPPAAPAASAACPGTGTVERTTAPFGRRGEDRAAIYLPPCYGRDPDRRFAVLVLLHGANADETQWLDVGVASTADALLAAGQIRPIIIVLPDGGPDMSDAQADSVTSYLLPWIDGRYRTKPDRAHRALGGISRGGRLALLTAAANPDTFCAVGGHSPAVRSTDATRDLADAVARHPDAYRLDVGATDALRTGVERFADRLGTLGSPTAVAVADGGHDRQYWRAHTADYLTFYSAKLSD